ncbi:MAG TPA: hypothetical protein PK950_03305 [Candidatus Paceibacterota bacterium]|nr:hypothetical protein [Candidatus Paceibacterota bacterium]
MENSNMEGFDKDAIAQEAILDDKLDSIQQTLMVQLEPLKKEINNETDFARKGLLIERYNDMAKQLGIDEVLTMDNADEEIAA